MWQWCGRSRALQAGRDGTGSLRAQQAGSGLLPLVPEGDITSSCEVPGTQTALRNGLGGEAQAGQSWHQVQSDRLSQQRWGLSKGIVNVYGALSIRWAPSDLQRVVCVLLLMSNLRRGRWEPGLLRRPRHAANKWQSRGPARPSGLHPCFQGPPLPPHAFPTCGSHL